MNSELQFWLELGAKLDSRPQAAGGRSILECLLPLLKLRDRDGRLLPLLPNSVQSQFLRDPSHLKIVLKARQLGLTTAVAARFFLKSITRPGTLTVQVAHDQESAEEIFKIVRRFLENLPPEMRAANSGYVRTSRSNIRQIAFPALDSEYRVETAASPNAGRGLTIQNLHCSEVARWPSFAAETLASLRAAVPAEGEIVLESTPNGAHGCFYQEWQRAPETGYTRHFFPWWSEPAYRCLEDPHPLTREEIALAARFGLDDHQIAFRRHIQAGFRTLSPQEFCEDAESCFLVSGESVFDLEAIEQRLPFCREQYCEVRENGALRVWYPPTASRRYLIAADPAGGGSNGDYSCAQVLDFATGLQCAELRAHLTPQELAARLAALAHDYNNALLVVERNNHGHAVLAHLTSRAGSEEGGRMPANLYEHNGQLGWLTTAANRPRMIAALAAALAAETRLFNSPVLLEECRTFIRQPNGSSAAAAGAHDDCVMAMAIALTARAQLLQDRESLRPLAQSSCPDQGQE